MKDTRLRPVKQSLHTFSWRYLDPKCSTGGRPTFNEINNENATPIAGYSIVHTTSLNRCHTCRSGSAYFVNCNLLMKRVISIYIKKKKYEQRVEKKD